MANVLANRHLIEQVSLTSAVGHSLEGRYAWLLESQVPSFIFGGEHATVDCGLIITDNYQPSTDTTRRIFETVTLYQGEEQLLPIEIKSINPRFCPSHKGGRYFYSFGFRRQQQQCIAFIIQNPAAPHLVAVIPQYYLNRGFSSTSELGFYGGREVNFSNDQMAPFPMEWGPFVMPFEMSPASMKSLETFYRDPKVLWKNLYNGITFDDCPHPTLQNVNLLLPTDSSTLQDWPIIKDIWEAFEVHSNKYKIKRLTIQPSVGDFQILHIESNRLATVELKSNIARVTRQGEFIHATRHQQARGSRPSQRYFTPLARWDFLFTFLTNKSKPMVLFSRDDLPSDWFREPARDDQAWLGWTPAPGQLASHTVAWEPKQTFVRQVEDLLDQYITESRFNAKVERPWNVNSEEELRALLEDEDDSDEESRTSALPVRPLRGDGFRWSRRLWETVQQDFLNRQCLRK